MVVREQREHSSKGMAYDRNALGIHAGGALQKCHPRKGVIELAACDQLVVQLLACLGSLGFSLLEKFLREEALIGGKALTTAAEVKKDITMLQKNRGQNGRSFGHRPASRVLRVLGSGTMVEQNRRKWAEPRRLPNVAFAVQSAAGNFVNQRSNDLLS